MGQIIGFLIGVIAIGAIVVLLFNEFPEEMIIASGLGAIGTITALIFKK